MSQCDVILDIKTLAKQFYTYSFTYVVAILDMKEKRKSFQNEAKSKYTACWKRNKHSYRLWKKMVTFAEIIEAKLYFRNEKF